MKTIRAYLSKRRAVNHWFFSDPTLVSAKNEIDNNRQLLYGSDEEEEKTWVKTEKWHNQTFSLWGRRQVEASRGKELFIVSNHSFFCALFLSHLVRARVLSRRVTNEMKR